MARERLGSMSSAVNGLRRTFASLLVALGRDPAVFMDQMGHTTANLTLSVYAKAMAWRDGERERLRALVEGEDWRMLERRQQSTTA